MSGGRYAPATCPKCRGPLAYGHATATNIFSGLCSGIFKVSGIRYQVLGVRCWLIHLVEKTLRLSIIYDPCNFGTPSSIVHRPDHRPPITDPRSPTPIVYSAPVHRCTAPSLCP